MLNFEMCLEDGQFEVHRSLNHSDHYRAAEIIVDHEVGSFEAIVVDPVDDGQLKFVGCFETFDQARRHLECEVTHTLKLGE